MLNKDLIKKRFEKSILTYNSNASIQKNMAEKLISLVKKTNFKNILEIGSYTGMLTRLAIKNFAFERYYAIDIVNSKKYIENLSSKIVFELADIENYNPECKFDLIIANASLQWCDDLFCVINGLKDYLCEGGIIAVSIFGEQNLKEIKDVFGVSLKYPSVEELKSKLGKHAYIEDELISLQFNSSIDILAHLKYTGVNSLSDKHLSIVQIKRGLKKLNDIYQNNLTYHPIYLLP